MQTEKLDNNVITETTGKKSVNEISSDISEIKWKKNCPNCGCVQIYGGLWELNRAIRNVAKCKKCVFKGRSVSEEQKEFLRNTRKGICNPMYGRKASLSTRLKMSAAKKGKPGKPLTEDTKHKLRLYRSKWVSEFAGGPQYNPNACIYFDELNKQNGWNLKHAENGGEYYIKDLGYF